MYVFRSDKGKLESSTRAINSNGTGTVAQISCNPNDANLLVLVGHQLFRMICCSDAVWRQYGFSKADQLSLTCAAWLTQDRLIAGGMNGKILLLESGELKAIYYAGDLTSINIKQKDELQTTGAEMSDTDMSTISIDSDVRCMYAFTKGFAFGYGTGVIHLFEKETQNKYRKRNIYKIPDHSVEREESDSSTSIQPLTSVNYITVNGTEDRILVTCAESQIYTTRLWGPDITLSPETMLVEMGSPLHHGPIGGMDVCSWKPIFITSGAIDRTLRIWNYETGDLELCKRYLEDMSAVALHPTGLFAVVGFSDKLRFITILIDDFISTREFAVRACKEVCFSTMGHLFAAVNGNIIQIYSTITFEHMFNLKGHNGLVRSVAWCHDDHKMASCGTEGAVYEWQVTTTKRISETIIKSCVFACTKMTTDGKSTFAVGSDGRVRELMSSTVHRDVMVAQQGLDCVEVSNSDMMLFVAGNNGAAYSVKLPILDFAEYNEYVVHCTKITWMRISYDDKYLITCSDDGCIVVWKLFNIEGKAIKLDKEFKPSQEILISKEDLLQKINAIKDLQTRMHELETEHAYQMRQNDALHAAMLKEVHEGYCGAIEELKEKNEQLEMEHAQEINNINMDISKMKAGHESFIQKLEASYNEKLIVEYNKYLALEDKKERMRNKYEAELTELSNAKKESEQNITNSFLDKLSEKEIQLEEVNEQQRQMIREHEAIKQQIEDDADREIFELKSAHEKELKEEQDANFKLRGETGMIKKKLATSLKEIDEFKHKIYTLETDQVKFKGIIVSLEKDIVDLKKEIAERDATIQDKEKRIIELKRRNQELDKFKFILEFKINELKSQIEPRDRQIREQIEQINDMVNELENLQKIIISLDLQLSELREKLKSADNELRKEIMINRAMKAALKNIRSEIFQASGFIQDVPKLIRAVKAMYHKYNADKDFTLIQAEDFETKNEFLRQRDFLERTVKTLKNQVSKQSTSTGGDKVRLIEENTTLINETNVLRKELKIEQSKTGKMESLLGFRKKTLLPKEAQRILNSAVQTKEDIHKEYVDKLKVEEKTIETLKDENNRLITKITEVDESSEFSNDDD